MSYPHWGAMAMKPTDFAKALSRYLSDYLPGQRNVSPNTIKSYQGDVQALSQIRERMRPLH